MPVSLKYRYTTGPISVSQNQDLIRVLVLNNGAKRHNARVIIYNLDPTPKRKLYDETFRIESKSQTGTEYITSFNSYEVQILTDSSLVYSWVGGRSGYENMPGTTVLNKELTRF